MTTLLVIAKAPVVGLAKTRLAPDFGSVHAARIAAASLLDTLDAVYRTPARRRIVALTGDLAIGRELPTRFVVRSHGSRSSPSAVTGSVPDWRTRISMPPSSAMGP